MSVAATEGEFLLISGKSYCLYSSARRDEMMSEERERQIKREVEQKSTMRRKSAVEQVQEKAWMIAFEVVERWRDMQREERDGIGDMRRQTA